MTSNEERQALRRKFIRQLQEMKTEAYSGLPSIEYDSISILIDYFKTKIIEFEKEVNNNGWFLLYR